MMLKVFIDKEGLPEFETYREGVECGRQFVEVASVADIEGCIVKGGKLVKKTQSDIQAEIDRNDLEDVYKSRVLEYGSVQGQLDEIYHDLEAWKARIMAIKVKYPKP